MANVYTCVICGQPTRDYEVIKTPFYFKVFEGYDNNAWGEHSNEAKVCDRHWDAYEPSYWFPNRSAYDLMRDDVISRLESRRVPAGTEVDYYFAPKGTKA